MSNGETLNKSCVNKNDLGNDELIADDSEPASEIAEELAARRRWEDGNPVESTFS